MERSFSFWRLILLFSLVTSPLALGESLCPSPSQIQSKWDLWSHGTCLRGANSWQKVIDQRIDGESLGNAPVGPPIQNEEFIALANWGANYVNLSVPGIFSETPPYLPNNAVISRLDDLISKAAKANLFVVLSFRTGPGRNEGTFRAGSNSSANNTIWKRGAAQDAWVQMWKMTALRYANHPNVVGYDLMVEPNSNDVFLKVYDSHAFYPKYAGTKYDWNPLAKRVTQAIRQVDANTPIILGSMNYSDIDWLWALNSTGDPKTVYAIHGYLPGEYTNQMPPLKVTYPGIVTEWDGTQSNFTFGWIQEKLKPLLDFKNSRNVPVAINEFGVMRWEPGADRYMADTMAIYESMGVNHAYWLWEVQYPLDFDEFNLRRGPDYDHHEDVETSALIEVIKANWKLNVVRPSNVTSFASTPSARRP